MIRVVIVSGTIKGVVDISSFDRHANISCCHGTKMGSYIYQYGCVIDYPSGPHCERCHRDMEQNPPCIQYVNQPDVRQMIEDARDVFRVSEGL